MGAVEQNLVVEDAVWTSSADALRWMFGRCHEQREAPTLLARMGSDSVGGPGRGLGVVDGAGAAGMMRIALESALSDDEWAALTLAFAVPAVPCSCGRPCCSGHKPNNEWVIARGVLGNAARRGVLAGTSAHGGVRSALVARFFLPKERRPSVEQLAREFDVSLRTMEVWSQKIGRWLGTPAAVKARSGLGLRDRAYQRADEILREAGWVGG